MGYKAGFAAGFGAAFIVFGIVLFYVAAVVEAEVEQWRDDRRAFYNITHSVAYEAGPMALDSLENMLVELHRSEVVSKVFSALDIDLSLHG
ncbi:hypothetical protein [Hyperthermus butylicus]|uniref:Uncharacterized protein n=1 Tax=Hyperthermus butylicus (strain DSM 5456 / JCM 9403 / PLM1-5) TaxID=415426 RepID=A2BJA9_HYPBU|nr:hypothetical protein [Hyperthermus butylicus]ABM80070.1 hypothetical protein Hbut_0198 [Hyperthermus butylicus DSM 5456]